MKSLLVIILSLVTISVTSIRLTPELFEKGQIEGIFPLSIFLVGTVDGKSFFADNTPMNWTSADAYCKSMNMDLASITSLNQAVLLNNSYSSNFTSGYWTSGRDALELRQFSWQTHEQPNGSFLEFLKEHAEQSCLVYHSRAGNSLLRNVVCTDTRQVLCDTGN